MKFIFDFLLHTWLWNHITHLILRHRCDGILEYKLFQTELWPQNSEPNQTKDIGGRETMLWIFSFRFSREHCSLTLFLRIFPFFFFFLSPAWAESSKCTTGFSLFISRICMGVFAPKILNKSVFRKLLQEMTKSTMVFCYQNCSSDR